MPIGFESWKSMFKTDPCIYHLKTAILCWNNADVCVSCPTLLWYLYLLLRACLFLLCSLYWGKCLSWRSLACKPKLGDIEAYGWRGEKSSWLWNHNSLLSPVTSGGKKKKRPCSLSSLGIHEFFNPYLKFRQLIWNISILLPLAGFLQCNPMEKYILNYLATSL